MELQQNNVLTALATKLYGGKGRTLAVFSVTDPGKSKGYFLVAVVGGITKTVNLGRWLTAAKTTLKDVNRLAPMIGCGR